MRKLRTIEMNRLSIEEFKEADKLPLIVVLDDVRSLYNVGVSSVRLMLSVLRQSIYVVSLPLHPMQRYTRRHLAVRTPSIGDTSRRQKKPLRSCISKELVCTVWSK